MKHQIRFTVIVEADHSGRALKSLEREARNLLPRPRDAVAGGENSRKGYYALKVKKVAWQSTLRTA